VYITHQLRVLSGLTSFLTSRIHQQMIKKFDACWVPDHQNPFQLSGKLSHPAPGGLEVKYIGPLSRLEKITCEKEFDLMVILSGPEPQRTLLEEKLRLELANFAGSILLVQGLLAGKQTKIWTDSMLIVNFMLKAELQECICKSRLVVARSGYSTIMDLEKLEAKAFFIPTPGQAEQVYLAKYLKEQKVADYAAQNEFTCARLELNQEYTGFRHKKTPDKDFEASLFDVFK
jgi:predicted glycosyltransferase